MHLFSKGLSKFFYKMNIVEGVFSSKVAGLHLQLHLRMNFLTGIFKYFAYIWGTPTSWKSSIRLLWVAATIAVILLL